MEDTHHNYRRPFGAFVVLRCTYYQGLKPLAINHCPFRAEERNACPYVPAVIFLSDVRIIISLLILSGREKEVYLVVKRGIYYRNLWFTRGCKADKFSYLAQTTRIKLNLLPSIEAFITSGNRD